MEKYDNLRQNQYSTATSFLGPSSIQGTWYGTKRDNGHRSGMQTHGHHVNNVYRVFFFLCTTSSTGDHASLVLILEEYSMKYVIIISTQLSTYKMYIMTIITILSRVNNKSRWPLYTGFTVVVCLATLRVLCGRMLVACYGIYTLEEEAGEGWNIM